MTVTLVARPAPTVRVRPVPPLEPPTDDELMAADWQAPPVTAPALPLEWPTGRVSGRPRGGAHPHGDTRPAPGEPDLDLSPARAATRRFLSVCLEVMGGYRPVTHLQPLCAPGEFTGIAHHLTGRTAVNATRAHTPVASRPVSGAPPRAGRVQQTGPGAPVLVRRVLLCEPREGAVEVAVVLGCRDRVWATALRLEERAGRWLCTYLRTL